MGFVFVFVYILLPFANGFYVPGVSPVQFRKGDIVPVKAVALTSPKVVMPYEYYYLPFCKPEDGNIQYESVHFGEILRGERVVATPYKIKMLENSSCKYACKQKAISANDVNSFIYFIQNEFFIHLIVDDLPASIRKTKESEIVREPGFPLGDAKAGMRIFNHLHFNVKYHEVNDGYRVVGVSVSLLSVSKLVSSSGVVNNCQFSSESDDPKILMADSADTIDFTYGVTWEKSDIEWTSRWDIYLSVGDVQIHWFSIINSLIIIVFLTAVISVILLRTLRRDIALYNREEDSEEIMEESGWKLVHGDVFRPPRRSALLAALVGSGVQLLCMTFVVLFFAMLGMLSPASRGALLTAAVFTYVFMGTLAGYFAGRIYKTMRGYFWKSTALLTGVLFPGLVLSIGLLINFFLLGKGSSAALPFSTMFGILCLWLLVSLPLVFIGFFFGVRKRAYEQPVRTNQIPRAIPERKMRQRLVVTTLLCGLLPFGSVFIELFFIFNAVWNQQFYYLFGFLFVVFIILIISCAQVAVVAIYFQLCSEDYHWWWRSFISSGGAAFYVFAYSIYYFVTKLEITSFVSSIVYFGYCLLMATTFWILTGTIGFLAAFFFLRRIYAAIKID